MTIDGLNDDFRDLLLLLTDGGVEFAVVGAYAVAFHGAPRMSGDIDLFARPTSENADRLHQALRRFGAPLAAAGIAPSDFSKPGLVYQIGLPPRRIDILTELSGVTFDEVWASRATTELAGRRVAFIGRETLIKNKRASGRPKDLADIARLTPGEPR